MRLIIPFVASCALAGAALAAVPTEAPSTGFVGNIDDLVRQNQAFRRVLYTGRHTQLVVMDVKAGESIGREVHDVDQCLFFVSGQGQVVMGGRTTDVHERDAVCVPAGVTHDVKNTGPSSLKLFTTYSPPEHPAGTVHETKSAAEKAAHEHAR